MRWLVSGKQRESDLDNKRTTPRRDGCTWPQVGERRAWECLASISWCFCLFSLLMSVRMQVSFFKGRSGGRGGRKTKQQERRKTPKEQAFLIKCLQSIYSKFCRHAVECWCRAQAHKSCGGLSHWLEAHSRNRDRETQVSLGIIQ